MAARAHTPKACQRTISTFLIASQELNSSWILALPSLYSLIILPAHLKLSGANGAIIETFDQRALKLNLGLRRAFPWQCDQIVAINRHFCLRIITIYIVYLGTL